MTTYPQLPEPREIKTNYHQAWMNWSIRQFIGHVVVAMLFAAAVLVLHGSGLVELPGVLLVLGCLGVPTVYMFVATSPKRMETKFHKTHPYNDYADPHDR